MKAQPNYTGDPSLCLNQLFEKCFAFKRHLLRTNSMQSIESRYRIWVQPQLGHLPVSELNETLLAHFYAQSLQNGMSRNILHQVFCLLNQLFEYLRLTGHLRYNPQSLLHLEYLDKPRTRTALTAEQVRYLLARTDQRYYSVFCFLLLTGLRRGEVLGLCWDCVHLAEKTVLIRRQLLNVQMPDGHHDVQLVPFTKNGRSHTLLLPDPALQLLERQRALQQTGAAHQPDLVFTEPDGRPIRPERVTNDFGRLMDRSGLGHASLHCLRHTTASLVLEETGSLQAAQHMLGHRSGSATLWYCHTSQERLAEFADRIAEQMDALLSGNVTFNNQ